MADMKIDLNKLSTAATAEVLHKPGAVLLSAYPLLTYAPGEHGPGIRTEDKGVEVASIATKAAEMPDYRQLADHFGTTAEHVRQAIHYAVASCPASTEG